MILARVLLDRSAVIIQSPSVDRPTVDLDLLDGLRPEYLIEYGVLPLAPSGDKVRVAIAEGMPADHDVLEDLKQLWGRELILVPTERSVSGFVTDFGNSQSDRPSHDQLTDARDLASQPPVVRLVNLLIKEAFESGASDLHLEAMSSGLRVRARIDGRLAPFPSPPHDLEQAVVSRLKLLAELDIADRRTPQDGRIRVRLDTGELDLRVATTPTQFGESVVLRLLTRGTGPISLTDLGMDSQCLSGTTEAVGRASGMVVSTGPTGSGKTTTLYAALGLRAATAEKIITVEDPIEYQLEDVVQVPVHGKAGVTFATALRSLLRQDPDVIMVGEMRDRDTATVATQAALTGHLVLTTLHTNDAITAVARLIDLGIEPFLVSATLQAVLAQRLVRKVCDGCRTEYTPDHVALKSVFGSSGPKGPFQRGAGCAKCRGTGYAGRTGLFELLRVNDDIREAIAARVDKMALAELARRAGLRPMVDAGRVKVMSGETTPEEVARVLGS
jgi:type II secretory ATPase GspE/PulE/Tfp pilus assembly ATPase PilB-like protein